MSKEVTWEDVLRRWPRLVAHVICQSLGYFTPITAARCVADYRNGRPNFSEYVACCFRGDPKPVVERAIRGRHLHRGYMSDYAYARALVESVRGGGQWPVDRLASWF